MKFLSKIKKFLDLKKKIRRVDKYIKEKGIEEVNSNNGNQKNVRNSIFKDTSHHENYSNFISRYEKIDVYRAQPKPKIIDHSIRQNIFNEVSKELENIRSKRESENYEF